MLARLSFITWAYFVLIASFTCSVDARGLEVFKAICGNRIHSYDRIRYKVQEACRSLPANVQRLDSLIAYPFNPREFIAEGKQYTAPGPYYIFPLGQEMTDQTYKGPDRVMINRNCQLATILTETRLKSEKAKICLRKVCNRPPVPIYKQSDFKYEECIVHVVPPEVPEGESGGESDGESIRSH